MQEMKRTFESPEEAVWATNMDNDEGGSKPRFDVNRRPNRKQRRALQSKMKKRVKQVINAQDKRNAKYRAKLKANSNSYDRTAGVGEVDPSQDFF